MSQNFDIYNRLPILGKKLDKIGRKSASALNSTLGIIVQNLAISAQNRIATGKKSPINNPWQAINSKYLAKKNATGRTAGILVFTGNLQNSLVGQLTRDAEAAVTNNLPYAAIHQFDDKAGRGRKTTIPARPYVEIDGQDARDIHDKIKDNFERLFQ